jgi:hypothetical protein
VDFAGSPHDIPLRPISSGSAVPPLLHPTARRIQQTSSLTSSPSTQGSDLEAHPSGAFEGIQAQPSQVPPSPSPPQMGSSGLGGYALDRPISHTDVPMPNRSQHTLRWEEHPETSASFSATRTITASTTKQDTSQGQRQSASSHKPLHSLKGLFSNTSGSGDHEVRPAQSDRKRVPKHTRRPAPVWLAVIPLPLFTLWGVVSALVMSTIIGFILSAVYNTAGFEMST